MDAIVKNNMDKEKAGVGNITWLNKKLSYESVGEKFNCDLEHWQENMKDMSIAQFRRFQALFFSGQMDEIEKFLEQFNINKLN